jgi:hypothetical protein
VTEIHTQVLGSGESIVLVEQSSDVGVVVPEHQLAPGFEQNQLTPFLEIG